MRSASRGGSAVRIRLGSGGPGLHAGPGLCAETCDRRSLRDIGAAPSKLVIGLRIVESTPLIAFGEFRLDLKAQRLRRGVDDVRLRQKTWEVLAYLAQRPGVVVSHRELLDAIWADVAVTPGVLSNIVWELRKALGGKESSAPFLQTIPKRGLRFTPNAGAAPAFLIGAETAPASELPRRPIGRDNEIEQLIGTWRRASGGQRQVVFVSGMPGVGKTTTVHAASREIVASAGAGVLVAQGHCLRLHGEAEPYLPILEFFEQLLAAVGDSAFADLARRFAPSWLVQLPWLVPADELVELRRLLAASGTQRVLHDAVRLLERLSEQSPILLILEDMQWADATTLDFLLGLAERSTPARLMVIATYRPIEVSLTGHPVAAVARLVCARGKASMLQLDAWPRPALERYLDARFADRRIAAALAQRIEAHTQGNPLFVKETVDYLVSSGHLKRDENGWTIAASSELEKLRLPDSVGQILDAWLAQQSTATVDALEAAGLIDGPFTVQEVAAAVGRGEHDVDATFSELASHSRLIEAVGVGRWPDATVTSAYTFSHALYQRALADRVAPLRRQAYHRAIALRLESAFLPDPSKVAARLALHFEGAGDEAKRSDYLEIAAASALARYAYKEGSGYALRAIESLQRQPPSPSLLRRQAERWLDYANSLPYFKGIGNLEGRRGFELAGRLAREAGDVRLSFRAQLGRCFNLFFGGRLEQAKQIGSELVDIAEATNPRLLPVARFYVAAAEGALGQVESALERMRRTLTMDAEPGIPAGFHLKLAIQYTIASYVALLGRVGELEAEVEDAIRQTSATRVPYDRLAMCTNLAGAYAWGRQWQRTMELSSEAVALADELECTPYQGLTRILHARAVAAVNRDPSAFVAEVESQLREREHRGDRWLNSCFYGWLAEGYQHRGELDRALALTNTALSLEELLFRSETWRIRAAVLDAQGRSAEAEECLRSALQVAQEQKAHGFHLRAAAAFSRFLKQHKRRREAREILQAVHRTCTSARGSVDFAEADAELRSLDRKR